jgi:hypothetical protein
MAMPSLSRICETRAWETGIQPSLLLIVREQVRPADRVAYDRIETEIRRVCERWGCPNAYLALTAAVAPRDVWWLTAWSSPEELERAGALYADNPALTSRLAPLNARKRALTEEPTTILAKAAGEAPFTLAGARFVTSTPVALGPGTSGALYDLPDGRRLMIAPSHERPSRLGRGSVLLAVQPGWSLPPPALADADPSFWGRRP